MQMLHFVRACFTVWLAFSVVSCRSCDPRIPTLTHTHDIPHHVMWLSFLLLLLLLLLLMLLLLLLLLLFIWNSFFSFLFSGRFAQREATPQAEGCVSSACIIQPLLFRTHTRPF